jgi:hypothetical protein
VEFPLDGRRNSTKLSVPKPTRFHVTNAVISQYLAGFRPDPARIVLQNATLSPIIWTGTSNRSTAVTHDSLASI